MLIHLNKRFTLKPNYKIVHEYDDCYNISHQYLVVRWLWFIFEIYEEEK